MARGPLHNVYRRTYHVACALESSKRPIERQFSVLMHKISHALHDIQTGENPEVSIKRALEEEKILRRYL